MASEKDIEVYRITSYPPDVLGDRKITYVFDWIDKENENKLVRENVSSLKGLAEIVAEKIYPEAKKIGMSSAIQNYSGKGLYYDSSNFDVCVFEGLSEEEFTLFAVEVSKQVDSISLAEAELSEN